MLSIEVIEAKDVFMESLRVGVGGRGGDRGDLFIYLFIWGRFIG